MRCPICAALTLEERMGAVHVDQCTQCKALWFDRAELAASLLHRVPGVPADWESRYPRLQRPSSCRVREMPARGCSEITSGSV